MTNKIEELEDRINELEEENESMQFHHTYEVEDLRMWSNFKNVVIVILLIVICVGYVDNSSEIWDGFIRVLSALGIYLAGIAGIGFMCVTPYILKAIGVYLDKKLDKLVAWINKYEGEN